MMRFFTIIISLTIFLSITSIAASQYYPTSNESGAFFNGSEVTYVYTGNYSCYPPLSSVAQNLTINQSKYDCYAGIKSAQSNLIPDWILVPAYAGMTIFGINSSNGMPVFMNKTVYTNCGSGNTNTRCQADPQYIYSPEFTAIENYSKTNSIDGKPYGILPLPAHSHLVNNTFHNDLIPWYVIIVYVFDPNIMPNATNGKCTALVASNVTNPTGNCLTSANAIRRALTTYDNATANSNTGNPIWEALGKPKTEVYIPNATNASQFGNPNTNIVIPFAVKSIDFYSAKTNSNTTSTTTIIQHNIKYGISPDVYYAVIALIIILAIIMIYRKAKANTRISKK